MAATNDDSGANTIDKGKLLVSNPHHSHSRKATTTAMGEQVEVWYRSAHHMLTLSRNTTIRHASLSPSQSRSNSDATISAYFVRYRELMLFGATGRFMMKRYTTVCTDLDGWIWSTEKGCVMQIAWHGTSMSNSESARCTRCESTPVCSVSRRFSASYASAPAAGPT